MTNYSTEEPKQESNSGFNYTKPIILCVLALIIGFAYWKFGNQETLQWLAAQESNLRDYQSNSPIAVYGVAFLIYVLVTGFSLPGAALMTLVMGWYFGLVPGVVLVSFASTLGATIAFLLSRYLFRETIQTKFGGKLESFNQALEREGAFYLFTLRLIPAVPFFVINVVMGLTKVPVWTYWWVSQVGMLAGTIVYVYAGSRIPDLQTLVDEGARAVFSGSQLWQIFGAFALLGFFPLAAKKLIEYLRPQAVDVVQEAS